MADYAGRYLEDFALSTSTQADKEDQKTLLTNIAMVHKSRNPHREIDERVNKQVP